MYPCVGYIYGTVLKWSNRRVCKTLVHGFESHRCLSYYHQMNHHLYSQLIAQNSTSKTQISPTNIAEWDVKIDANSILGITSHRVDSVSENNLTPLLQDIYFAATWFIGTILVVAIIRNWFQLIYKSDDTKQLDTAKKNITNAFIWLVIVMMSFIIVKFVQFISIR